MYLPTLILRHRKENLKKCSLRGLESREDFRFYTYPKDPLPPLDNYILLKVDAPPLTIDDKAYGLLLIDATWRYADQMLKTIPDIPSRSLPRSFRTAYPRRQEDCPFGLASIEALYLAYKILERDVNGLLDTYYWKEAFLKLNSN